MSDVNLAFVVLGTVAGLVVGRLSVLLAPRKVEARATYLLTPMQMEQVRDAWFHSPFSPTISTVREALRPGSLDPILLETDWNEAHFTRASQCWERGLGWQAIPCTFVAEGSTASSRQRALALLPNLVAAARGQAAPAQEAPHV